MVNMGNAPAFLLHNCGRVPSSFLLINYVLIVTKRPVGKGRAAQMPERRLLTGNGSVVASRSLVLMSAVSPPISFIVLSAMPLLDSARIPPRVSLAIPPQLTPQPR